MDPAIIIGSGLGGLALAHGLHKSSVPFKIYEHDQLNSVRTQGYRIRIHSEGLCALRTVLTDEVWDLFEETCPETVMGLLPNINALTCEVTAVNLEENDPQSRIIQNNQKPYTVDRAILREVLLTGLNKHVIYGKEYTHYRLTESGTIAHFADGTSETASMLVGADGVHSAVRRQYLPHLKIYDTKSRPIYGKTPRSLSFQSRILPKAMECLCIIKDPQNGSVSLMEVTRFLPKDQRKDKRDLPNDYVYWVIIPSGSKCPVTDEKKYKINKEGPAELAKALTAHWHPSLRTLIEHQDPSQTGIFRLLSSDPESLMRAWEPNGKITLLGDAAHAMIPATAGGAVTALRDAELLSTLIREHGVGEESIAKYEEEMRRYASEAVALSAKVGQMNFGLRALADAELISV